MRSLYEPVYPGVYCPGGIALTARERAQAAWLWSRRKGVVAGNSAAALLGAKWVSPTLDAELVHVNRHAPAGIVVHSETLLRGEVVEVDGMLVTSPARTAFDVGRWTSSRLFAVQRLDALANATDVKVTDIEAVMAEHRGTRGLVRLKAVLPLVDSGAESPQETRTRLLLIDAGLPVPQTQIRVCDDYGDFIARIDMGTGSCGSASSTTGHSTGRTPGSAIATSTGTPHWPTWAGRSSGLAATFSAIGRVPLLPVSSPRCAPRDGVLERRV